MCGVSTTEGHLLLYIPCQRGGNEGQLAKCEQLGPIVELHQESVGQLGSAVEEVLLQRGQSAVVKRPQQPILAEERVIAEEPGQSCALGHHRRRRGTIPDKNSTFGSLIAGVFSCSVSVGSSERSVLDVPSVL